MQELIIYQIGDQPLTIAKLIQKASGSKKIKGKKTPRVSLGEERVKTISPTNPYVFLKKFTPARYAYFKRRFKELKCSIDPPQL